VDGLATIAHPCTTRNRLRCRCADLDQGCFKGTPDEQQAALAGFHDTWEDIRGAIKVGHPPPPGQGVLCGECAQTHSLSLQSHPRRACRLQDLQRHTMAGVLGQLQQWAAATAAAPVVPGPRQQQGGGSKTHAPTACGLSDPLPVVALSVASSTNTAETYTDMLVMLRQQVGCCADGASAQHAHVACRAGTTVRACSCSPVGTPHTR
jgi:hypothetical protein